MEQWNYHKTEYILQVQRLLGHKNIQNALTYINLEGKLFSTAIDGFTQRVAHNAGEACSLTESGFEYVTGECNDGGKIFRRDTNMALVWFSETHGEFRCV